MYTSKYNNLVEATNELSKKGFATNFKMKDGKLTSLSDQTTYQPTDLIIEEHHRFEGMTNPADMSILYVVSTQDGKKGIIIDTYGADANGELSRFMKGVPKKNSETEEV